MALRLGGAVPETKPTPVFLDQEGMFVWPQRPIAQCLAFVCDQHGRPAARPVNGRGFVQIEKVAGFCKCGM